MPASGISTPRLQRITDMLHTYLDDKKLEAKDMFIEEYQTDPLNTPEDKLVVHVFVPLK